MKERIAAAMFLVLAMGVPANSQSSPANRLATHDFLSAGTELRPTEGKRGCWDFHAPSVPKARSTVVAVRPLLRADWRIIQPNARRTPEPPHVSEASLAIPRRFAILDGSGKAALPLAFSQSESQQGAAYTPPTGGDRARWMLKSSFGWRSLGTGLFAAAFETARNRPEEWHGTWEGFGKRFGTRQAGVTISNSVESTLGAVWGEDPRYFRSGRQGIWTRTGYALKMAILAQYKDGTRKPAYARFAGPVGSNFATNTWRPTSENDWQHALARSGWGIVARMLGNLVSEFWR